MKNEFTTQLRVRYGETDQMGFVYYGNYAQYYEVGRVEAMREMGIRYKDLEEDGILLPVVKLESKYIKPAQYDDLLLIATKVSLIGRSFIRFESRIYNEEKLLLNEGVVTLCFVDAISKEKIDTPEIIQKRLEVEV